MTFSLLAVGFLMGLRHALEADHVAAVAALAAGGGSRGEMLRVAGAWGAGHAAVLAAAAVPMALLRRGVPEKAQAGLEALAGVVLIGLGVDVVRRARRRRVHFHVHDHADGTRHLHAHAPDPAGAHGHRHVRRPLARALAVGGVHGLAGSAVIGLVALDGLAPALGYALLLGTGATAGMLLLTAGVTVPLGRRSLLARVPHRWGGVETLAGLASAAVGSFWLGSALLGWWAAG